MTDLFWGYDLLITFVQRHKMDCQHKDDCCWDKNKEGKRNVDGEWVIRMPNTRHSGFQYLS